MSRVSSLHRLQELDLAIARSQERVEEIQRILEDDTEVQTRRAALELAESGLAEARAANAQAEANVASQRSKIEQTERTLYSGTVRNPKVLQDHQQEAESLKRYLITLEDRLLEAMIELEAAQQAHEASLAAFEEVSSSRAAQNAVLTEERGNLETEIGRLQNERLAALEDVAEEDLRLYNQLRQRLGDRVVALVQDGSCSACGLNLSSSDQQAARSGDDLVRCTQCSRILYAG